jgi:hypothetical protein
MQSHDTNTPEDSPAPNRTPPDEHNTMEHRTPASTPTLHYTEAEKAMPTPATPPASAKKPASPILRPPRAKPRGYLWIGRTKVEVIDSWYAERDGRDWTPPPRYFPASFRQTQTQDSWIVERDERGPGWHRPASPPLPVVYEGGDRWKTGASAGGESTRRSPTYEPYADGVIAPATPAFAAGANRLSSGGGGGKRKRKRIEGAEDLMPMQQKRGRR